MEHHDSRQKPSKPRRAGTVVESIDESFAPLGPGTTDIESPHVPSAQSPGIAPDAEPYRLRPSLRPPMALLCAYDDGQDSGETVRIRIPSFVIGRADGNLVIPHDGGMSGRHAEISRRFVDQSYRWTLRDLGSTNGTFIRTARALLHDGQEFLIGGIRYRFDSAAPTAASGRPDRDQEARPAIRRNLVDVPGGPSMPAPRLVEIKPHGEGLTFQLTEPETWIGRDPRRCGIVLDHPAVSPRHAVIRTRRRGRRVIENAGSRDGVWLRFQQIELGRGGQFQCGEQRFLIRIL
jgi:pSer/pThr/pTyr-binding forkhead associated (FHA) protein